MQLWYPAWKVHTRGQNILKPNLLSDIYLLRPGLRSTSFHKGSLPFLVVPPPAGGSCFAAFFGNIRSPFPAVIRRESPIAPLMIRDSIYAWFPDAFFADPGRSSESVSAKAVSPTSQGLCFDIQGYRLLPNCFCSLFFAALFSLSFLRLQYITRKRQSQPLFWQNWKNFFRIFHQMRPCPEAYGPGPPGRRNFTPGSLHRRKTAHIIKPLCNVAGCVIVKKWKKNQNLLLIDEDGDFRTLPADGGRPGRPE